MASDITPSGGSAPATPSSNTSGTTTPTTTLAGANSNAEFRIRIGYLDNYLPMPTQNNSTASTVSQAAAGTSNSTAQYTGILAPLAATNGLRFPYTPSISNNQDVDYGTMTMAHANTDYHAYSHTPNVTIGISGKFTVQNYQEGIYALGCIHFLRTVSRMYFGADDATSGLAGIPPPILQLNGYGTYMYNKIRVYVKSHSVNFDEGMDTVNIQMSSGYYVRLPAIFTIQVNLVVQNTSRAQRKDFTLDKFKSGNLMETTPSSSGWI